MLHLFSQPRAAGFLTGQQEFSAANPWFSVKRMDGVTHFPALEIPDAPASGQGASGIHRRPVTPRPAG